mmetsp:Transcript_34633/g.81651  ORF Transcript_34633/g.81651 Transcript_34633/m.81651 type:complete len:549 (-) Transcript_34633:247-1893(-)
MKALNLFKSLVALVLVPTVASQECRADGSCDSHEQCPIWRDEGECYRSPTYMRETCKVSCDDMEESPGRKECKDIHKNCPIWKELAECETNASVKKYCPLSCEKCKPKTSIASKEGEILCEDDHENCGVWADSGECDANPGYMLTNCKKACNVCKSTATNGMKSKTDNAVDQAPTADVADLLRRTGEFGVIQNADGSQEELTLEAIRKMMKYVESDEFMFLPKKIKENCKNKENLCSFWAAIGECENNKSFMKVSCAPACQSCHLIDMATRCPEIPDAVPALREGDLNKMFERIVETAPANRTLTERDREALTDLEMPEYSVTVHSRPSDGPATEVKIESDRKLPPWVITLDNFLTEEECDSMIQLGYNAGYKRSEDVGAKKFDGFFDSKISTGRTSENAWCTTKNKCRDQPVPKRVLDRLSHLMGIKPENSEDFQILKYEVGQFYNTHHDYIPHQKTRQCGPRVLTFFLYLSDVEAGGGTDFPSLGITVMPKKGRAVLWPSVYSAQPMEKDERMRHQALPVVEGTKFGANAWIHMYDYQFAQANGCN